MDTIGPVPCIDANGAKIPLLGLGTWELRGRACARIVEQALRLGYRHLDTAQLYENEREVGEGLHAPGVKRDDVFVTTKIWPSHFAPRELERSARAIGVVDDQFVAGSGSASRKPLQRKPAPHAEYGAGDLADTVRTEAEVVAAARAELACPFAPAP